MWTWLPVLALILVFFFWMAWVLHKRTPPRPGEEEFRQDHKQYYEGGGGG